VYSIALSVSSCLRAGTDVTVAWIIASEGLGRLDPTDAVALTPGGGRIGQLADGAFDSHLAGVMLPGAGRLMDVELTPTDALIAGLPSGARARIAVVAAGALPGELWGMLLSRTPLVIEATLDGALITDLSVGPAAPDVLPGSVVEGGRLVSALVPVRRLAISGDGPIAQALEQHARLLGWQVAAAVDTDTAIGVLVGLSFLDAAVIIGHDVESSSRALAAALEGGAGYIGALGSARMQQLRSDWLAYRGVTDQARVHGPAGLDIRARTPAEVALSVLAEAVSMLNGVDDGAAQVGA
jgi:xanthine dehydrogenase accessory factor